MKFKIKHRYTNNILFACDAENMRDAVLQAVKSGADLSRADLYRADLSCADLSGADLSGADLYDANLSGSDLSGANLSGSDLYDANLSGANLSGADLSRANLSGANLSGANLSGSDLYDANLSGADLSRANLSGANLYDANLSGSDLYDANLSGANLSGANLSGADLSRANLSEVKGKDLIFARQRIIPEEGAFIGWKKLKNNVIAKLIIPHDAGRINCIGSRKCRAEKAFVEEMFGSDSSYDQHTGELLYKVGEWVIPDSFDPSNQVECSNGIHFFLTRIEAENY